MNPKLHSGSLPAAHRNIVEKLLNHSYPAVQFSTQQTVENTICFVPLAVASFPTLPRP